MMPGYGIVELGMEKVEVPQKLRPREADVDHGRDLKSRALLYVGVHY